MIQTDANPAPRARRREANLERILDTALELVGRDGLAGLHMAKLADAVDYTPGALYRYVDSKDALVAHLVTRTLAALQTTLATALDSVPARTSPLARVFALVLAYRRFVTSEPHQFGLLATAMAEPRILVGDANHTAATARAVIGALTPLAETLTAAVAAEALTAGEVTERTLCMFTMLHGLAQLPKLGRAAPTRFDPDALSLAGVRTLLIGWGATPRAVDAALTRMEKSS